MKDETRKKITKWFWILFMTPFVLLTVLLLAVWAFADIPSFRELENPDSKLATQIISSNGEILTTIHDENRLFASYNELSPYLVQAAVATEDARFYKHSGIDFQSLGRVLVKTLIGGDSSQGGGSTITQQLAKTLYPREDVSSRIPGWSKVKMVWVKLKEWITAVKLERNYTKDEIMDMYMNAIFFGSNAYGIKSASRTFFAKNPSELTIEESATLVGMVNKPTRYNPVINPEKSLQRRNFVISQMEKAGYITEAQRDSIQQIPINVSSHQVQDHNAGLGPYFKDMLLRTMKAKEPKRRNYEYVEDYQYDSLRWENDGLYGWLEKNRKADGSKYDLYRDGLRIYSTIDSDMQRYAEEAVAEHLGKDLQKAFDREQRRNSKAPFYREVDQETIDRLMGQARRWSDRYRSMKKEGASENEIRQAFREKTKMRVFAWNSKGYVDTLMSPDDSIRYYKGFLRAAFVAIEPLTGHVKAYVGGPNYRWFKYDNCRQGRRQVGSTIKPFLYSLAMQDGLTPCTEVVNVPQTFIIGDDTWTPRSTDKDEWIGLTVNLKWGLTKSANNISAYLMKQFGPKAMAEMMHKMGIHGHIEEVESLCVGSTDQMPFDMVAAYNTFPSRGMAIEPLFVTRIEDSNGNRLSEFINHRSVAISEYAAYEMVDMMQSVVNHGTGIRLRAKYGLKGEIAGKTGTTNDNSDGWFIGYTPKITAGIWVGGEDRQIHFGSTALGGGSNMALPIWGLFMKKVLKNGNLGISEADRFTPPAGIPMNIACEAEAYGDRRPVVPDQVTAGHEAESEDEGFYFE